MKMSYGFKAAAVLGVVVIMLFLVGCGGGTAPVTTETTKPPETPGAPAALVFENTPVGAKPGSSLATQPIVQVKDAKMLLVTTATNPVTLSIIYQTPPGLGVTLTPVPGAVLSANASGTLTVIPVQGKAKFTGLTVNATGRYCFQATSPGLTPSISYPFDMK